MSALEVINGTNEGATHQLEKTRTIVGRHPDCDIIVEAPAVSRQHAAINEINGAHFIEDLRSRNGTFVNDKLIPSQTRLNDNDLVRICDVVLLYRSQQEHSPATGVFFDDTEGAESSIMSKLDLSSSTRLSLLNASAADKLDAIVELTKTLSRSLSLDAVLEQVLVCLFSVFLQADRGFIVLRGKDGSLQPRWTKYRREDNSQVRISRTILNRVMDTKEAILSADASDDQRFDMAESIMDFSIRSMMCAPLIDSVNGNVLGALQIDTQDQRNRFREDDLEVFGGIASQAAMALVNAELHEVALEKHALQKELELAHEVQRNFLPKERPQLDGFAFYDYYRSANQIGGDYFDYIELPNGHLVIIVADVAGHGIASALMMAKLAADVRFCIATDNEPDRLLTRLNDMVCSRNSSDRFVTSILLVLDPQTNVFQFANAAHNPPVIRRANDELELIGEDLGGLPLGIYQGHEYRQSEFKLEPNETLVLFTDGVPDAMNRDEDRYGDDRFRNSIQTITGDVEVAGNGLINDVRRFTGGEAQNDDMCLVCIRNVS